MAPNDPHYLKPASATTMRSRAPEMKAFLFHQLTIAVRPKGARGGFVIELIKRSHHAAMTVAHEWRRTPCLGDLCAFGGHHPLDGRARQHAPAVLDDARQLGRVDPVALDPATDREQVPIA